jgi:YVTN family beta-propeller protein
MRIARVIFSVLLTVIVVTALTALAAAQRLVASIDIGGEAGWLAVNPTTNMIYVPNMTLDTVTVIDGTTNAIVANIPVGGAPAAAAVNTATNMIYVTVPETSIQVIDGSSNTVVATVPTFSAFIAVNPATNLIYFNPGAGRVSVLDGATNQIITTILTASDDTVQSIAVNSTTNRIYVSENGLDAGSLTVIDGKTNNIGTSLFQKVCDPRIVAVDNVLNRIYVGDDICFAHIVNGNTNQIVTQTLPGSTPVVVNPANHIVGFFNFDVLSFVNGSSLVSIGKPVSLPINLMPQFIVANRGLYYVVFYKSNGVAVVSGPAN